MPVKKQKKKIQPGSWLDCVSKARKQLKVKGFMPLKKGSELYKLAKKLHEESKKNKMKK